MKRSLKNMLLGGAAAATMLATIPAFGQETATSIRGQITDPNGNPLAGQTITITNPETGISRTTTTSSTGTYNVRGLAVGGPYTIRVDSNDYTDEVVNGVQLQLGVVFNANIELDPIGNLEEIVVSASALTSARIATGPASTYNLADIENAITFNRDIKDLIRQDARVYINEADDDNIQCGGANPRFNSITIDGAGLNDNFGLNRNGYPTIRVPYSINAIKQVSLELAPFDVEYGQFTACNINAVTKSGTNEFHGGAFYEYTSDSFRASNLEDDSFSNGNYTKKKYGVTLGGPIIQDKLFFFGSYEELDGVDLFDRGPAGSGKAREIGGVSQAQYDEILRIARDVYNYDPGGLPESLPVADEKIIAKIDWNITDQHRLALTYLYNDGFEVRESDSDNDELEFSNHYYNNAIKLKSYTGSLYSNWTDNLSTEMRVSYTDVDKDVASLGGTEFGEVRIETFSEPDAEGNRERALVYLGSDDSRQANDLNYSTLNYKLAANYQTGDHTITVGLERIEIDVFNLFVQEAEGEIRFRDIDDLGLTAIQAFEAGRPERFIYENAAGSNDYNDAAATFKYNVNTAYIQDEYFMADAGITITAGLRYDWYTSSDVPTENPNFIARNGFSNATNFDGRSILLPRLGIEWDFSDDIKIHGGIGLYSGGNPNVWLSNNYSNNGITQVEVSARDYDDSADSPTLFTDPTIDGGDPIYSIPTRLYNDVASGTANSGVNAVDPDFKIPTEMKIALGTKIRFDAPAGLGNDYLFSADVLYSKMRNAARIIDTSLETIGTAPDGRPLFASIDRSIPECVADPTGNPFGGCHRWFASDYILTNADGGRAISFSAALEKSYENGIDWSFAYSYTDSKDVAPMTSSVAFSNFSGFAASDRNNPESATSNYVIPHRFTAQFSWAHDFWDDNTTRVSLYGQLNQGRPFSYVFVDGGGSFNSVYDEFGDGVDGGALLYVPTGADDPNVVFGEDFNQDAFFTYLEETGLSDYAGEIAPRNGFHSNWWSKVDLKITQDIPAFMEGHKAQAYMVVNNLTNLIDSDWGVLYEAGFPRMLEIVDARIDTDANKYIFNEAFLQTQDRVTTPSQWEIKFGIKYDF